MTRWGSTHFDQFVEKEIDSGTDVERKNFKAFVKTFLGQIKDVKEQVNVIVKLAWQKATKIYEAAYVKSALIFKIDDEPILGVDTLTSSSIRSSTWRASIALNGNKS